MSENKDEPPKKTRSTTVLAQSAMTARKKFRVVRTRSSTHLPNTTTSDLLPLPTIKCSATSKPPTYYFRKLIKYAIEHSNGIIGEHSSSKLITKPTNKPKNIKSKGNIKQLLKFVEDFLELPNSFSTSWAELFHVRLICEQNVLFPAYNRAIQSLIMYFIEHTPQLDDKSQIKVRNAKIFLSYLQEHRADLDNSLIGLRPSTMFLEQFLSFTEKLRNHSIQPEDVSLSKQQLLDMILSWDSSDDSIIAKRVRNFINHYRFQSMVQLQPGDLLIASVPKQSTPSFHLLSTELQLDESGPHGKQAAMRKELIEELRKYLSSKDRLKFISEQSSQSNQTILIVRFQSREGDEIRVWADPSESERIIIHANDCFPFSPEMIELTNSVQGMKRLLQDEVDQLNITLRDNVKMYVEEYLQKERIDLDLITRVNSGDCRVLDLFHLRHTHSQLLAMQENHLDEFLDYVEKRVLSVINMVKPNICMLFSFHPLRSETVSNLSTWPYCTLAKNRIRRYIGICSYGLDQLRIEIKQCYNGSKKIQLSEWWMDLIRGNVKGLLRENNYDFTAINIDYIDTPPKDLAAIHSNLELIREILNVKFDVKFKIVDNLVNPLKSQIYPKLEEFKLGLIVVLMIQPFYNSSDDVIDFNIDLYERILSDAEVSNTHNLPPSRFQELHSIIQDVRYIEQMKILETHFSSEKASSIHVSDVVPISGLVMNYFHRMEVELSTVLELWDPKHKKKPPSSPIPLPPEVESEPTNPSHQEIKRGRTGTLKDLKNLGIKLPALPQLPPQLEYKSTANYTPEALAELSAAEVRDLHLTQMVPLFPLDRTNSEVRHMQVVPIESLRMRSDMNLILSADNPIASVCPPPLSKLSKNRVLDDSFDDVILPGIDEITPEDQLILARSLISSGDSSEETTSALEEECS